MSFTAFTAFLLAATLLAITPGPGMAYVVAQTVAGGRRVGLASCLGTAAGGLLHVLAAALGLSLILAESALAFQVLKYLGGAYLIYLGLRIWCKAGAEVESAQALPAQSAQRALLEGVLVEAVNVKTALFFLAFLPQFVTPSQPLPPQLVGLGCICVALNTSADVVAVFGAQRLLQARGLRAARAKLLARLSGATLIGLGALLALAKREA